MIKFREKNYSLMATIGKGIGKAKTLGFRLATNPGSVANDGVKTVIRKPLTAAGTVAPVPGGTLVGMGADKLTHKVAPKLPAAKEKLVSWYNKRVAPTAEGVVNTAFTYFKGM